MQAILAEVRIAGEFQMGYQTTTKVSGVTTAGMVHREAGRTTRGDLQTGSEDGKIVSEMREFLTSGYHESLKHSPMFHPIRKIIQPTHEARSLRVEYLTKIFSKHGWMDRQIVCKISELNGNNNGKQRSNK
jgi:hypothetical protein